MPLVFDKPRNINLENLKNATNKIKNITGNSKGYFNTLWDGGFAGISETGVADLKLALNNYASLIEEHIALFNASAYLDESLSGQISDAVNAYIEEIKGILKAFVSQIRVNVSDLDMAYDAYMSQSLELTKSIYYDNDDIRNVSKSINLE